MASPPRDDATINLTADHSGVGGAGPTVVGAGRIGGMVGAVVDGYKVLSVLGEGGFGDVYLAEQSGPIQRMVALKVIKPGMDSRQVVARFEQERQTLALMDHPSLATIYHAGVTPPALGSRPFFAMEVVRGEPITRFCGHERLGVGARVRLMVQVCAAVQHAHMKGVIHRDLKPSNILVEIVDGKPSPKVIDFGVAKALRGPLTSSTLVTELGQLVGTPEYMSPEQARGSADIDTRADVYALGAILYELLTGAPPFESASLRSGDWQAMQRMLEAELPARPSERVGAGPPEGGAPGAAEKRRARAPAEPAALSRQLRGDLDWIVMKCLEKERSRRYDSASTLAADLERYLNGEPVLAGPPSASYRIGKFVGRNRAAVAAAGGVAAALVVGIAGTSAGMAWAMRERGRAESVAEAAKAAKDESEAVTNFLASMLQSVDPEEKGREVTVHEVLEDAGARIGADASIAGKPAVESRLRLAIANSLRALGRLDESEPHLARALEIRANTLGADHEDTLRALANLASLKYEQGKLAEAQELTYRAVEGLRRTRGVDDRMTLGVMNNLAQLYTRLGRVADAEAIQREVLEGQTRAQGPDHAHTLGAAINLALMCQSRGALDEAEALLRRAMEGFKRAHGADHPGTLLCMGNLALLDSDRGNHGAAEELQRATLAARERVLGGAHPDTIGAASNLGLVLAAAGKVDEAEGAYARAFALGREHLGETHPTTVTTALGLLELYERQGWPERSRELTVRLLAVMRALAAGGEGENATPDTLNSAAWLMLAARPEELRDAAGALPIARAAVDRARRAGDPDLWMYLDTLALALARNGSAAEAAAVQREAVGLIPPAGEGQRAEMEGRLAEYLGGGGGGR